jgi:hypothetical protein
VIETASACLNCGERLSGPFCARCGQRAIPAYPTMRELIGDAWHELSGYDGKVVRTFRDLLAAPGAMTVEVLEGHRARYVSPVRVYLVASLVYFLIAAASPNLGAPKSGSAAASSDNVTIDLTSPEKALAQLTPEKRAELNATIERTVWWMRPVMRAAVTDPAGFERRLMLDLPRMFFVLVPVFALIVSTFYRRRPFSQHLIFGLHLHAVVFLVAALPEAADYTYSLAVSGVAGVAALLFAIGYAVLAFKRVYRERWLATVSKTMGIGLLYGIAALVALLVTLTVVSVT